MTWVDSLWLVAGVVIGVSHALGISRSVKRTPLATAIIGMVRLLIVALALTGAAVVGGIIPTALGWGMGFFATVVLVWCGQTPVAARRWGRERSWP